MKKIRVLVIDPFKEQVIEKKIPNTLQAYYKEIGYGCNLVEAVNLNDKQFMFVDEEGTFEGHAYKDGYKYFFWLSGMATPIMGKAIVFDGDDEGNTTASTAEKADIEDRVTFLRIAE
jgi:hypothetical protein